ncbi:type II secretion system protein [Candidatus Saccharibacteria bacterium]|nr:type II secretion system protein [Candidatus Saccharibacteria bacterium]
MKKGEKRSGFTIIEVSLVLAIAGLIFLMVFIALPQLQRSQRDSRRRDDILMFLETVKKYQTNNRGALPTDWQNDFATNYLGGSFIDPDGAAYALIPQKCTTTDGENCDYTEPEYVDHNLYVFTQATCNGEKAVPTSNPRNIAVVYKLEGAGVYCANT